MARGKRAAAAPKPEPKKRTHFRAEPNAADAASAAFKKIKKLEARKLAAETALAKKQEEIEATLDSAASEILRTLQGEM